MAGVEPGTRLEIGLLAEGEYERWAQITKDELSDLGMDVDIEVADDDIIDVRVYEDRNFDMHVQRLCQRTDPEIGLRRMLHSSAIMPVNNTNSAGYRNAEVDAILDRDLPVVQNLVLLYAFVFVVINLITDMSYAWLDPRIRYE